MVPPRAHPEGRAMEYALKSMFEGEEQPLGTWISVGHPVIAEISAMGGFDFLLLDTEHTSMSLETVENMVRAVDATDDGAEAMVRIPTNDPVRVKRILDIGVSGVMVPMIETAEEARSLVEATRYPPEGIRGIATGRATAYGREFHSYVAEANDRILTIVQIETRQGLENADEIARVDGIDALFVGPADLSGSLGVFGEWDSEELTTAMHDVIDAGTQAGVPVGTLTVQGDDIGTRLEQGFDFLIIGKDTSSLMEKNEELRRRYDDARSVEIGVTDGE